MAKNLKFFTDKHVPKQVAIQLRNRGVDVLRCEEIGMDKASDDELLEYAAKDERTMVSFDEDFLKWDSTWRAQGKHHCGIMRIQSNLIGEQGIGGIVKALFDYYQLIEVGAGTLEADIYDQVNFID